MTTRTVARMMLAVLALAGCSDDIGALRECVSIVGAAVAAAPRDVGQNTRANMIVDCILQRGKATSGGA
jgi:hypothetical protein